MALQQEEISTRPAKNIEQLDHLFKRAEAYLQNMEEKAKKVENLTAKIEEAQAKADNEALRAFQAKTAVEEHSNFVAKVKGSIDADATAIGKQRVDMENLAQALANLRSSCESSATDISNFRKTIEQAAKTATETSEKTGAIKANIEEAKKNIDTTSQKIREQMKTTESDLAKISANRVMSDNLIAGVQKIELAVNELHERVKSVESSIQVRERDTNAKADSMTSLIEKMREVQTQVTDYETNLARLERDFNAIRAKVEGLLPGATSAGLASSFCIQKKRFKGPQILWISLFVLCMVGLLGVAQFTGSPDVQTWDGIMRHLAERLPFLVPLVWLGIYSGRQYMHSLRMEEEYAFKESLSTAFEGYKREMSSIPPNEDGQDLPINALCGGILTSLMRRPGLIYEGKQEDITPLNVIANNLRKAAPSLKALAEVTNGKKGITISS